MKDGLEVIARIRTDFDEKFGVPRQSGLVEEALGTIVFEPKYRTPDALKGIEGFEYLWVLWRFDVDLPDSFNATVRPPMLGGNETMGVFATRSPFRPNRIAMSSVKLIEVRDSDEGKVLMVSGVDMRDNTAVYDIKPYLAYTDSHPGARGGFTDNVTRKRLSVIIDDAAASIIPADKRNELIKVLEMDPRPRYIDDPEREYGISFAGFNIKFNVSDGILTVKEVMK